MHDVIEQPGEFIYTKRIIENGGKFVITEIIPLAGTPPEGFNRFRCRVEGLIGAMPDGQPILGHNDFAIDAQTPAEAFRMLPELVEAATDELKRDAPALVAKVIEDAKPKPEIVVASAIPSGNNGDPCMQFPGVRGLSSKRRRRRSR